MKTPIQELIEVLKKEAQYISDNDHIEDRTYRRGLREAIQNAESMLEKEEEFMKSVWLLGVFGKRVCMNVTETEHLKISTKPLKQKRNENRN